MSTTTSNMMEALTAFHQSVTQTVLERGRDLVLNGRSSIMSIAADSIEVKAPAEQWQRFYEVALFYIGNGEAGHISGRCGCKKGQNYTSVCKHQVAASLVWMHHLKQKEGGNDKDINDKTEKSAEDGAPAKYQRTYLFELTHIDPVSLEKYSSWAERKAAFRLLNSFDTMVYEITEDRKWVGRFGSKFEASIQGFKSRQLSISCNCPVLRPNWLCAHVVAVCEHIVQESSYNYFSQGTNHEPEKNELLANYGLSPDHSLAAEPGFGYNSSDNLMVTGISSCLVDGTEEGLDAISDVIRRSKLPRSPSSCADNGEEYTTGLLFNFKGSNNDDFLMEPVRVKARSDGFVVKIIHLDKTEDAEMLYDLPHTITEVLTALTPAGKIKYLADLGHTYLTGIHEPLKKLTHAQAQLLEEHTKSCMHLVRDSLQGDYPIFLLPRHERLLNSNIQQAVLVANPPQLQFRLEKEGGLTALICMISYDGIVSHLAGMAWYYCFLRAGNRLLLPRKEDEAILKLFSYGKLLAREREWPGFLRKVVLQIASRYPVDFNGIITTEPVNDDPAARIYLSEYNERYLHVEPKWKYGPVEVDGAANKTYVEQEGVVYEVQRNVEREEMLLTAIRNTHTRFLGQRGDELFINVGEALEKNWFLTFYDTIRELAPVYNVGNLHKFRYNLSRPVLNLNVVSGVDWFDLKIEVQYGLQVLSLESLQAAIRHKQPYALLEDGTQGVLPQEWIEKYSLLLNVGKLQKGNFLRVSRFNWMVLAELESQINEVDVKAAFEEKKKKLLDIENVKGFRTPKGIKASPRSYQKTGFQWLCLLDEMGWGGCLADDMGLGKTLQTIMFIQYLVNRVPGETHLVVCPTSLIYNWESELKKFAPSLSYYICYGADRRSGIPAPGDYNVILTTYGVMRNDIDMYCRLRFGYIILDESHTIRNSASQVARSVRLLKARNRIAISGTPLQNNSFDIYSQMEFLNPGMLGSAEFFRNEFANPIDKQGDAGKAALLRKMIYPFILRRTKEQVASDLPDKVESIIWCEMDARQRETYNWYRDHYRTNILEQIEHGEAGKNSLYILEALTRLRQICDSPQLLKRSDSDQEDSVKLQVIKRELLESTGQHKVLVFSQFTTMLELIAAALKEEGIASYTLTGKTSARERTRLVKAFQEETDVNVFLISLKAGGVGLNLTAADYVYLVDPWWNPAAEQQAIDRTHRIGQQQKVVAYKMLCKNTVEEKMLLLQEKKKKLSAGIISDEAGFVKKLTKEDVAFLFT